MAAAKRDPFLTRVKTAWSDLWPEKEEKKEVAPKQQVYFPTGGTYRLLYAGGFNGEKNLGEIGPIKYYLMDYIALGLRSWQAFIESPQAQTILKKYTTWVIGKGLKLQCEPVKEIVGPMNADLKAFSSEVEARFRVYANSKRADWSGRRTLNQIEQVAHKNAIIQGDLLVILRYEECLKIQLVDSFHLQSPMLGSEWFPALAKNGNRIVNGVEINSRGEHVAYYVRKPMDALNPINSMDVERVPAKATEDSLVSAFLVYGLEFRIDTHRGIPLLTAVLEKLKKLERYDEATLGTAEEQAKIAYQVVHQLGASGEYPFAKRIANAHDADYVSSDLPADDLGRQLASKVEASTNKTTVNNPPGAEVKPFNTEKGQLYYKDFLGGNVDVICSCVEMPPDVAMSKYQSNYSASRAAIKDWEHVLMVKRKDFSDQFMQNIYNFWLDIEILTNMIQAPGYLIARASGDFMVLEAYRTARFVGAPVANIDPMKEVQAERLKLGVTGAAIPLTTAEQATEILNGGEADHNMEQYAEELEMSKDLGIELPPEATETVNVSE